MVWTLWLGTGRVHLHHFSKIKRQKEVRIQIQEAQKHTDPTDPDPKHWLLVTVPVVWTLWLGTGGVFAILPLLPPGRPAAQHFPPLFTPPNPLHPPHQLAFFLPTIFVELHIFDDFLYPNLRLGRSEQRWEWGFGYWCVCHYFFYIHYCLKTSWIS